MGLNLIYHYVKIANNRQQFGEAAIKTIEELEERVSDATRSQFLKWANEYSFAFGRMGDNLTFSEAILALRGTVRALGGYGGMENKSLKFEEETLEQFILELDRKIARTGFHLLLAVNKKYFKAGDLSSYEGKSYSEGAPILIKASAAKSAIADRVCLQTNGGTQAVLMGKGEFAAPGFLDECSPKLVSMDSLCVTIDWSVKQINLA